MANVSRRSVLKFFGSASALLAIPACGKANDGAAAPTQDKPTPVTPTNVAPPLPAADGYLSIVQGPTSQSEALINVFAPRLKTYEYVVTDPNGALATVEKYETVKGPVFYHVDKIKVSGLRLGVDYTLKVMDRTTVVDERTFRALDTAKTDPTFAILSCMSDDRRFESVIDPMWRRLQEQNPDLVIMCGDEVYVDSFEFVERQKATEQDLWQRYVDSFRRLPIYHWRRLTPVLAVWDDHDYGTNDGDRDFVSKEQALRLFRAVFGGKDLNGTYEAGPHGCSCAFTAFGQRFFLMDDRMFRQPNKNQPAAEPYGHWGRDQHEWLVERLAQNDAPAWIVNGNQFFNGVSLSFKEAFEQNHSAEFIALIDKLKALSAPVVFASGDVHLSEIMRIPKDRLGYETFEVTSSSMHSFTGSGWDNPMRLAGAYTKEYNFLTVRSRPLARGLDLEIRSHGLPQKPYFSKTLRIDRHG